jgi:hypothetical protein
VDRAKNANQANRKRKRREFMNKRGELPTSRIVRTGIALAVALGFFGMATGARAVQAPTRPVVVGPRTTTDTTPTYRFRSKASGVPAARIRYRCSFDSTKLRKCAAKVTPKLKVGKHVLRVRAVTPSGALSAPATASIVIKAKGPYRATASCPQLPTGGTEMTIASPRDGARLYAIRFGTGRAGNVLAPGGDGSICDWAPAISSITSKGFQVLVYEAGRDAALTFNTETWAGEVSAVAEALRQTGVSTIFLGGASFGAGAALDAVPLLSPKPRGVVFLAGTRSTNRLATVAAERGISFLFLTSRDDSVIPASNSQDLYAATTSPDKKLVIYPTSLHAVELYSSPFASQIKSEIADWLAARAS